MMVECREGTRRVKDGKGEQAELARQSGQESLVVWTLRVVVGMERREGKELTYMKRQHTVKKLSEMGKYKKIRM